MMIQKKSSEITLEFSDEQYAKLRRARRSDSWNPPELADRFAQERTAHV
jgi:hypothetical protein